ncbi:NlpC/P60 family protein [Flavobacterium sp.]|uniref:C40 family peptidase n=1 Tax=Flavobacterium sp. TaxID=239 RepID=UPI00286BAB30|nr:NlpC/P60 family protein [Flavobacterium sp.]
MKRILPLLLLFLFVVGCKSTSSIITSKEEAQKRGIYKAPANIKIAAKNNATPKSVAAKEVPKKAVITGNRINDKNDDDLVINVDDSSYLVKQLINAASENLGAHYRTGGTTPDGFDCSGLMYSTFKKFDITLPRSSVDMAKIGRKLDEDDIRKGDLIFFKTNGRSVINHVGMVIEINDEEIKFIHSSTQKGVIISSTKEAYYGRTFTQANRILE